MEEKKEFIFTITYNFDGDYVAKKCDTYEEAVKTLKEYLTTEIKVIKEECDYTPSVLQFEEDDVVLVYAEGYVLSENRNYALEDCAYYRIFEV